MKIKHIFKFLIPATLITFAPIISSCSAIKNIFQNDKEKPKKNDEAEKENENKNEVIKEDSNSNFIQYGNKKIYEPNKQGDKFILYSEIYELTNRLLNEKFIANDKTYLEKMYKEVFDDFYENRENKIKENIDKIRSSKIQINSLKPVDINELQFSENYEVNKLKKVEILAIKDGDTFSSNDGNTFRFNGVDTPETRKKESSGAWIETTGQQYKYGTIAKNFSANILTNAKEIYVSPQKTKSKANDETHEYFDPYKRIVAIVYYRDKTNNKIYSLNEEIVFFGIARMHYISLSKSSQFYTNNTSYYQILKNADQNAKNNHLGIYSEEANFNEIYPKN
ncbi:thermonuclease family protein [Metamycoplasma spumans]|uniref:thermonuclease family protein n=1 Tax=Metamycoplasma spumans TaxID=92406 RepID=UPI0034DDA641